MDDQYRRNRPIFLSASTVFLFMVFKLIFAVAAQAASPQLTISDLGQTNEISAFPQPGIVVTSSGNCPDPFTLESGCSSWPALGSQWGSGLNVAGGDELQLTFTMPMTSVMFASTTNFPPEVAGPAGAGQNANVIPVTNASEASSEPQVWDITLPSLDPRSQSGFTFSIVGVHEGISYDYPLTIRSPRSGNPMAECAAPFYYNTGEVVTTCASAVPPGLGDSTDGSPSSGGVTNGPTLSKGGNTKKTDGPPPSSLISKFALLGHPRLTSKGVWLFFAIPVNGRSLTIVLHGK